MPTPDCVPWLRTWRCCWLRHSAIWRIMANYAPSAVLFIEEEISSKLLLLLGGSGPPSNTWLLGPTPSNMLNAISIEPTVSSGLTLHYPYTLLWDGPFLSWWMKKHELCMHSCNHSMRPVGCIHSNFGEPGDQVHLVLWLFPLGLTLNNRWKI